ncbi:AMP-binding protein [Lentzea tibetensis]|uniref:AMP-binding protein n=1 Tax=Lentzea tibetensis TaxID=2591470 RepID=A0A563F1C6_9PSEU|nr:AMP-binding protein [Lentzea tibetensis]TWP53703.1 AMP-binding protein [Lentzea tibetensis]
MTYVDGVLRVLTTEPDREVLIGGDRRLTRAEARDLLLRYADGLHQRGVRPGDGVAVFVGNTPESVLLNLSVHLLGGRLVFVTPERTEDGLRTLVAEAQVKGVVVDDRFDDRLDGWPIAELPGEPVERAGEPGFSTVLATGGTTGVPKHPVHGDLMYEVLAARAAFPPANVLVSTLVTHGTGHIHSTMGMVTGSKVVMLPQPFDAGVFIETVRAEQITVTNLVTPMLFDVLDHPDCPGPGVLHRIGIGGSPISPVRLRQALERFGPVVWQGYGLSEALGVAMMNPADIDFDRPETLLTCGRPFPGIKLEIRDGVVWLGGPTVMRGYWGQPPLDGMLDTGDMGHLDSNGFLYLVDRSKDVIVTGPAAGNVYSRLIDDFLVTLPGIRAAAAVGAPDERYGEAVHVFVVPEPGFPVDTDLVRAAVAAELGELYEPRGVTVLDRLPSTRVGKVDKKALRSTLA